ncbi:MAG: glycosyltransferase family 61 protein [Desulfovibrio sp.]|jgi:capsular polysaccharide biosynthesis protein|nr:glycosyltransferase family 61 protein [Desulfovibrio sp.]
MRLLKNATIIPLEGTMDSFTGGIYSADGKFIEDSLLYRGKQASLQQAIEYLPDTYIYGGCLFGHFGHFIWESLSRLYAIRQCKNYPILFISPNIEVFNGQKILFKTIGIRNEIKLIKVPTSIRDLIYSPPGSSLNPLCITDEQIDSLKYFNFSEHTNEKIWLSRAKLKIGKLINELSIETEIQKIGYKIIHPEILPLQKQVKLISTSDVVAGCDGSAFFSLLFAKYIHGKFFVFNRRKNIPSTISYVFTKRNVKFEQYVFDLEPVEEKWPISIFRHSDPSKIAEILK